MKHQKDVLIISMPKGTEEIAQVAHFISVQMFKRYGSRPPPAAKTWIAWSGEKIAGSLGFDCCDTDHAFEFQKFFLLDELAGSPAPPCCETVVYSRWIAVQPDTSLPLLYAVTCVCLAQEKNYGWAVMKPGVASLARKLGVELTLCPSEIKKENLIAGRSAYYLEGHRPEVYKVNLRQVKYAAELKIAPMLASGRLIFKD